MVLEKIEQVFQNGTDKEVHFIAQKFDLIKWANISNVFLGNVLITRKTKEMEAAVCYQICVYLNCNNESKQKVITVINPNNNLIKIDPSSLLEVVIFGQELGRWSMMPVEDIGCFCIRNEIIYNDVCDVYDPNLAFCPEPRNVSLTINSQLTESKFCISQQQLYKKIEEGAKENHFWINLDIKSLKQASTIPNGNYSMGSVEFSCKDEDEYSVGNRSMELMLSLRGSNNRVDIEYYKSLRESI